MVWDQVKEHHYHSVNSSTELPPLACIVRQPDWGLVTVNGCFASGWVCLQPHAAKATIANLLSLITSHTLTETHNQAKQHWVNQTQSWEKAYSHRQTFISLPATSPPSHHHSTVRHFNPRNSIAVYFMWSWCRLGYYWLAKESETALTVKTGSHCAVKHS